MYDLANHEIDHEVLNLTEDRVKQIAHEVASASGTAALTFLGLSDTPGTFVGQAGKSVQVNAGATALEFATNVATDEKVGIDAAATPGYIGAASNDGVLRTDTSLTYTDGGNFVTLSFNASGATAAGADTQIQYNDGGNYGAEAAFTYTKGTNTMNVDKIVADSGGGFGTGTGYWFGDGNTGFYESADNLLELDIATGGAFVINDDGNDVDLRIESANDTDLIATEGSVDAVGIGVAAGSIGAKLHVDQTSATGAKPVLTVDQADVSEEFVRFIGTAAAADVTQTIVDNDNVSTATLNGWLRVYVQDDGNQITDSAYYIPIYSLT